MNNIMLDLETLGNKPGCIVVAIGAVEFGRDAFGESGLGAGFYQRIDPRDAQAYGLTLDADTFLWWLGNSTEARAELTRPGAEPLTKVLYAFTDFYRSRLASDGKPRALWGNGSDFDQPILAAVYQAARMTPPWSHYQNRCYRTVKNLHRDIKIEIAEDARHNALEDAKAQARHLMAMLPEI